MNLYNGPKELLDITLIAIGIFFLVMIYTRIVGLRSFAKMSGIDFATTIAIGSMIASAILPSDVSVIGSAFAILMVYSLQWISSRLKAKTSFYNKLLENSPVYLIKNNEIQEENMNKVNISFDDLRSKLREANVFRLQDAKHVILESTGDVSVLHSKDDLEVDEFILKDVK